MKVIIFKGSSKSLIFDSGKPIINLIIPYSTFKYRVISLYIIKSLTAYYFSLKLIVSLFLWNISNR